MPETFDVEHVLANISDQDKIALLSGKSETVIWETSSANTKQELISGTHILYPNTTSPRFALPTVPMVFEAQNSLPVSPLHACPVAQPWGLPGTEI